MKKRVKIKLVLLTLAVIFLYSFSITPRTVAQESITIWSHGCSACNQETNVYEVDWTYTGVIPYVSIYLYDEAVTTIEYVVVENTPNLNTYNWSMPVSHTLDGNYSLVVCDSSNHNVNDTVYQGIYPILTFPPPIPGFPIFLIGLITGITSVIAAISLTKKLRKR
ncbi:MAG: hypothetical protein JSV62_16080 [Promethearchaeota archaeon]|nr:MAG: hypothetical protein JSV62_16080 [Candidatus Lokiarchaeota archaeon]